MPARLPAQVIDWHNGQPWLAAHAGERATALGTRAECEARCLTAHGFGAAREGDAGRWSRAKSARLERAPLPRWTFVDRTPSAGRNLLVTWAAFRVHALTREARAQLDWVGVERAPLDPATLLRAVLADPEMADLEPLADELALAWPERIPGMHRRTLDHGRVRITLLFGEPHDLLPRMGIAADVSISDETDGETPTVPARALPAWFAQPAPSNARSAVVIGAGLAGAAAARAFAERGLQVHVLDTLGPASGASGAPRAVLAPHIASWVGLQTRVVAHAFLYARAVLRRLSIPHEQCGLLHPLAPDDVWSHQHAMEEWGWPQDLLRVTDAAETTEIAGLPLGERTPASPAQGTTPDLGQAAVWVSLACVTQPALTVRALLDHPHITMHSGIQVSALERTTHGWKLHWEHSPATGASIDPGTPRESELVILATAGAWTPYRNEDGALIIDRVGPLAPAAMQDVPFDTTRGQLTMLAHPRATRPETGSTSPPRAIISANGFVMPPLNGTLCAGATYERDTDDLRPTTHDDALNVQALERLVPALYDERTAPMRTGAWTGLRATVRDHCPIVGAVHDSAAFRTAFAPLCDGPFAAKWPAAPLLPGLFATLAHGSRGTSTALLAGELLADIALGGVRCVPDDLLPALLPQRFLVRALRRSEGEAVP